MPTVAPHGSSNAVAVERFRRDLGPLWSRVEPLCRPAEDAEDLQRCLCHPDLAGTPGEGVAPDLQALLAGWDHYDAAQRAVLTGAVTFVAEPALHTGGPRRDVRVEDDRVVRAAVRAVLRHQ